MRSLLLALACLPSLAFASPNIEENEQLRYVLADEIMNFAANWVAEDEEFGAVWVVPYESEPEEYSFELIEIVTSDHYTFNVGFGCGTEYDESMHYGSCEVDALYDDKANEWVAVLVDNTTCECAGYR
jgi:hypothetical protein